jgi:hypothetical protein
VQEALAQAAEMENPSRLLELLDTHGYPILARSEFASFARWLKLVPHPLSQPYPMFLAALAWFRAQTERAPNLGNLLGALEDALEAPPPSIRRPGWRKHVGIWGPFGPSAPGSWIGSRKLWRWEMRSWPNCPRVQRRSGVS